MFVIDPLSKEAYNILIISIIGLDTIKEEYELIEEVFSKFNALQGKTLKLGVRECLKNFG